jgi:hypothetical protein
MSRMLHNFPKQFQRLPPPPGGSMQHECDMDSQNNATMLLRPAYLSQKLERPLPTKDGGTLRTIGDPCSYMTGMDKKRELRQHWQRVAKLILAKEDVLTISRALELALFMDVSLDVSKAP